MSSRSRKISAYLCALIFASTAHAEWNFGWEGSEQGVWSGSDPAEFVVGTKPCDYKIRGRSGVWSDFKGTLSPGKIVIGVVNPREPDIIFFQLKKASPFLLAAKRSCFQGETPYVEDPVEAHKNKKLEYNLAYLSFFNIRDSEKISSTETMTSVTNVGCLGGGFEWVEGYYRLWTGACLGFGSTGSSSSVSGVDNSYSSRRTFQLPIQVGGYYDLPNTPYGAGLELMMGLAYTRQTPISGDATLTSFDFNWSLGMAWRVYIDQWTLVPKFGLYDGISPKFFEFQAIYNFL